MTSVLTTARPQQTAQGAGGIETLPAWLAEIERLRAARAAHFFVLHGNVADYVYDGALPPYRLLTYLVRYLRAHGYERVGTFSISEGLAWASSECAAPGGSAPAPAAVSRRSGTLIEELRQLERVLVTAGEAPTAVVIEHLDFLVPASASAQDRDTASATEILLRLALDDGLRAAPVTVIGLARSLEAVAPALADTIGAVAAVAAPLPGAGERRGYLTYLASPANVVGLAPLAPELSLDSLVNLTQGMTLGGLDAMNRVARMSGEPITSEGVRAYKTEAIERQSHGLLEELEPRYGFDSVGGLAYVIDYLRTVVAHLRERRLEAVPKGILLAGPPGTGKTLVAEALATEAGFNLVRLGDVRSKWVGETERNLSQVLRLLLELAPVVVFADEVDQAVGRRTEGWDGDSGVSARIFARILNFMGKNEHRGRVVWMAATNRPDLLDEAMIRRFDRVFPFFVPGPQERERILRVMPKITGAAYAPGLELTQVVEATEGLTGSALETIVRRAMELADGAPLTEAHLLLAADDYKPNHDPATYERQSLLALNAANLFSALPAEPDMPPSLRELVGAMRRSSSPAPLWERLRQLRCSGEGGPR